MQEAYFKRLNHCLRQQGTGLPQLIVDLDLVRQNIAWLNAHFSKQLQPRLVVKSLASLELLQLLADDMNCQRFMLFHLPHLAHLLDAFPDADLLFGKPMPIQALQQQPIARLAQANIQYLIDTLPRLKQYQHWALEHGLCLKVNLEIDVGLHRGGIESLEEFETILKFIQQHPQQLKLSGLMGYDAHIAKLPKVFFSAHELYEQSQQRYLQFIERVQACFPDLDLHQLCLNGAGSLSLPYHVQHSVCNELSFGSALLKPKDFDHATLQALSPALWIATPVLKVLPRLQLPALEKWAPLHRGQAICIYGGYWRGQYVYPATAKPHVLYGRSTNQELLQVAKDSQIQVDDYVFMQPSQSEALIPQFANLYAYEQGQLHKWSTFRE